MSGKQLRRSRAPAGSFVTLLLWQRLAARPRSRQMPAMYWGTCCSRAGARFLRLHRFRAQRRGASWECGRKILLHLQACEDLVRFDLAAENASHLGDAQEHQRLIKLARNRVDLCAVKFSSSALD